MYFSHKGSKNASPEVSCSDCKLELIQRAWTKLLLHWLNRCVNPKKHLKSLTTEWLVEVIKKYKEDIVDDDVDRAILCTDDLEPFLRYKYPILRLRYFTEDKDLPKKLYIMTSVLLYHCCICSHTGAVENDICHKISKDDREMILKFCESLSDMEITLNNVEVAIKNAVECIPKAGPSKYRELTPHVSKVADKDEGIMSEAESIAISDVSSKKMRTEKVSTLTFKASVTVMPSHVSVEHGSFSKTSLRQESSLETSDTYSLKLDDFSETTTVDSVAIFSTMEKEDSGSNVYAKSGDSKSRRDSISSTAAPTDESIRTVISRSSKRETKLSAEQMSTVRSLDIRDSKMERYREGISRRYPTEEMTRNKSRFTVDTPGPLGEKSRFKREVCCVPAPQVGEVNFSGASPDEPCRCLITTSEDDDETSFALDDNEDMGEGDMYDSKASDNKNKPKKIPKKREPIHIKKTVIPKVHTYFIKTITLFSGCKGVGSKKKIFFATLGIVLALLIISIVAAIFINHLILVWSDPDPELFKLKENTFYKELPAPSSKRVHSTDSHPTWAWQCTKELCMKVYKPKNSTNTYSSLSRCILLCSGPQLWPHPLGMTYFSKELVGLATDRLEYKFKAVPSDLVNQYLAEAFKLFLGDLARLERIDVKNKDRKHDIEIKKMHINIEVETDSDPRMRVNTDESYYLKLIDVDDRIKININSPSFAGVRHGLETLSQIILLDQSTGNLITLSEVIVKDAPSYKYRGLMLDTARNYIPLHDILRTIDGMATCKLNTFHWRITDSASFPLLLPSLSNLFEYGAYHRGMVYTKQDVKTVVYRAGLRGIRVLIEVAIPGPVGRAWSWSDDATCPKKNDNFTCDNVLCLRLKMQHRVFELLQHLYSEIIDMTGVDDVFHMSDSVFSLSNCYYLIDGREGFLEKALDRLRRANKGFLPKLPIIWYTQHLSREAPAKTWERFGVQIYEWPSHPDRSLSRYKVIHSGRWDLSCDVRKQRCTKYRSWQEMYSWKSWRNIEAFSIEGGEALLWTDLVDSGNLDFHLWPRAAAVAERLWSDLVANATASGDVYVRLDNHRWRMLLRGLQVQPIWPVWCSFNPASCLSKLLHHEHK